MYEVCYWFLVFFIFSIIGYISEVIFCFIGSGKLTNRGFLHGTYCPIYGFGSLLIILFLSPYNDDPIVLFILSVLFTSALEYFTSWAMEKLFNNRWWDYSNNFGNINGRVCLFNSLCFGVGALAINYLFYPVVSGLLLKMSATSLIITSIICFIIIFTDLIITTNLAFKFKKELEVIKNYFDELKITIPKMELFDKRLQSRLEKYRKMPKHFINAFPNLSKTNSFEIKTLKELLNKNKQKEIKKQKKNSKNK